MSDGIKFSGDGVVDSVEFREAKKTGRQYAIVTVICRRTYKDKEYEDVVPLTMWDASGAHRLRKGDHVNVAGHVGGWKKQGAAGEWVTAELKATVIERTAQEDAPARNDPPRQYTAPEQREVATQDEEPKDDTSIPF